MDVFEVIFGWVFYFYLVNNKGKVYCFFFLGKLCVVFLWVVLVLCLEFLVVIVFLCWDKIVKRELDMLLNVDFVFWIDSMLVFCFVENEKMCFYMFVVNWIVMILDGLIFY